MQHEGDVDWPIYTLTFNINSSYDNIAQKHHSQIASKKENKLILKTYITSLTHFFRRKWSLNVQNNTDKKGREGKKWKWTYPPLYLWPPYAIQHLGHIIYVNIWIHVLKHVNSFNLCFSQNLFLNFIL